MPLSFIRIFIMIVTAISLLGVIGEKENEKLRNNLTVITCVGIVSLIVYIAIVTFY